jgi:hypothetical protein
METFQESIDNQVIAAHRAQVLLNALKEEDARRAPDDRIEHLCSNPCSKAGVPLIAFEFGYAGLRAAWFEFGATGWVERRDENTVRFTKRMTLHSVTFDVECSKPTH